MIKQLKKQGYEFKPTDCDLDFISSKIIEFYSKDSVLVVSELDGCFLIFKGGVKPKELDVQYLEDLVTVLDSLKLPHNINLDEV